MRIAWTRGGAGRRMSARRILAVATAVTNPPKLVGPGLSALALISGGGGRRGPVRCRSRAQRGAQSLQGRVRAKEGGEDESEMDNGIGRGISKGKRCGCWYRLNSRCG